MKKHIHIVLAIIPAPNEPPNKSIDSNPSLSIISPAHFPYLYPNADKQVSALFPGCPIVSTAYI